MLPYSFVLISHTFDVNINEYKYKQNLNNKIPNSTKLVAIFLKNRAYQTGIYVQFIQLLRIPVYRCYLDLITTMSYKVTTFK